MRIVAAVFADFVESFLGGPSQLTTAVGTCGVLAHTLTRLMRVDGLTERCLFVRPRDEAAARAVLAEVGLDGQIEVLALDDGARPRRELLRTARKWNLDAWRGSPLGTTWFDEYVESHAVARVLDHYRADAVLCLDGHQPVLDPTITSGMLAYQRENAAEARIVFTQAPPGLAGILLGREFTREVLQQDLLVGTILSYRPEMPRGDPIMHVECFGIDSAVAQTSARLTGDTRRSRERIEAAFVALGDDCDASSLCAWLRDSGLDRSGPLPTEVEIELTTEDPLPNTAVRPRGKRVPRRQLDHAEAVSRVAAELGAYDDRLVVLGGHGDPLLHPRFGEVCRRVRSGGVCGLAVATPLIELSDDVFSALFEQRVDVVEVLLDANSPDTYRRMHGSDHFERVLANIDRIQQARKERLSPCPLLVCSLTRCAGTLGEMEAFFDRWIVAAGWAVIRGYSEFGGLLPPDDLLCLTPPVREPCRRLGTRLMLLADGAAVLCDQDVGGQQRIGNWLSEPLTDLWAGSARSRAREAHASQELCAYPLCERCREWYRT